ncbi:MAG: DUF6065 family protein [Acidobacteriota bacterium]|jgi:hypothetical protein
MKLECYLVDDAKIDIGPAPMRRDWIDEMPGARAYHCIPLSIANAHGWEIRSLGGFEATWNGGVAPDDVEIRHDGEPEQPVRGHFGSGILTFETRAIFVTEPGTNLWVMGPTNRFKDGIQSISALVETDWMPFTFTMNWKFTRPGQSVRFERGEPYCFVFPVQHALVREFEPRLRALEEDEELARQYRIGLGRRRMPHVLAANRADLEPAARRLTTQEWYKRGLLPDGKTPGGPHFKSLQLKDFERDDESP